MRVGKFDGGTANVVQKGLERAFPGLSGGVEVASRAPFVEQGAEKSLLVATY
jgi:hypothetical protein